MINYKNLSIIGTSHIAIQSVNEVESFILSKKPTIIALELDHSRYMALISKKKIRLKFSDIRKIGLKGFIFSAFGAWLEKKLGKLVGVVPGSEMKKAITLAKEQKTKIALIDQNIQITLNRLSKKITFKERLRFIADIIKGLVFKKTEIKFDLTKVPEESIIKEMIKKIKI